MDVFDQIAAKRKGDVFDQIAAKPDFPTLISSPEEFVRRFPSESSISSQSPALTLVAPEDFPGPAGIPMVPSLGRKGSLLHGATEVAGGLEESIGGGLSGMTSREGMATLPLFSVPYLGPALALVLGGKTIKSGLQEMYEGIREGDTRKFGKGAGTTILGGVMTGAGVKGAKPNLTLPDPMASKLLDLAREKALEASLPQVGEGRVRHEVPENIYRVGGLNRPQPMPVVAGEPLEAAAIVNRPVRGTIQPIGLPEQPIIPREEAVGTLQAEPSGLRLAPEQPAQAPQGGIPATAEMLETLPQPTIEELAINELLRGEGSEMRRLVEEEGKAVERTGALPQPAEQGPIPMAPLPAVEPSGLRLARERVAEMAKGGIPTGEGTLELLPKPKAEEPSINELLRGEGDEMRRLVAEEGARIARTGEALPQPATVKEPVSIGQPGIPAVPEASGLRMVADVMPETAKGGLPAVEMMLDLLPEGQLKEIAMNELTRQGVERGEALRRVEALGDAFRRAKDFSKAQAEKAAEMVRTQVGEGVAAEAHPAKPMTANQLRITYDALTKALQENRLSEERPGIIAGSKLEAWADDVLKGGGLHAGPDVLAAYVVKGAALLERGITDIAKWTAEMVKQFGKEVTPYLKQIRSQSEALRAATFTAAKESEKPAEPTKSATAPATPATPSTPDSSRISQPLPSTSKPAQSSFMQAMSNLIGNIKAINSRRGEKRDMAQTADAMIDTIPANKGRQAGNELRVLTRKSKDGKVIDNKLARQAAVFVIQAGGDRGKLATDLVKVKGNAAAEKAIRYAQANWTALQPLAQRTKLLFDEQINYERDNGVNTNYEEHYVPQRHENILTDKGVIFGERGGVGTTAFKKAKVFPDYASAIQAGYTPRTLDIADLVEHRVRSGQRLVNRKLWAEGFKDIVDPATGEPIATDLIVRKIPRPDGTTDTQYSAPQGYAVKEIIPGVRIAVRQGYQRLFDALTKPSQIRESLVGQALLTGSGKLKHYLLALDSFHAVRTMETSLAARGSSGYNKGLSILEYSDRSLGEAVRNGLITKEMAEWVRKPQEFEVNGKTVQLTPRQVLQSGVRNGLNVGRFADALYNDAKSIVGTSKFSIWLFEKLTRGAMGETFLSEFARVAKDNPELNSTQVARKVARDVNVLFGNLQRQSFIKNPAIRDLMQMVFLAPQWVESLARREARAAGQAIGSGFDLATGKGPRFGTVGKTVGTGLAAYVAVTQLLNYITRGHSTFENREEGHKLDAWIPDLFGKSEGFWFSPMAVFGEITHDLIRYSRDEPTKIGALARIAQNKLGPLGRALSIIATQEDTIGTKLPDSWEVAKEAGLSAVPTPIALSPLAKEVGHRIAPESVMEPKPGTFFRQFAGSVGQKIEPYNKDEAQIARARRVNTYIEYWTKRARQMPIKERGKYLMTELKKSGFNGPEGKKAVREFHEAGLFTHP